MQSPLTPQRGRIESNPREYTHMERRACDELEVMPLGSRCALAARCTRVEIWTHERGKLDTLDIRPAENPLSCGDGYGKVSSPDRQWLCRTIYSCSVS